MAANNIFQDIAGGLPANISPTDVQSAREWFRTAAKKVTDVNMTQLFKAGKDSLVKDINTSSIGSMFLYAYDPKWKDRLPYYDIFPLVFITELYSDGWLGLNLHYLPPYYRAKLMDALYDITLKQGDRMKVQMSYSILKSASRFRFFTPCVKRYLSSHVQGRLMFIDPDNWDAVMMLPLARFVKAGEDQVYKDSRRTF